jgi:hypothetical protein
MEHLKSIHPSAGSLAIPGKLVALWRFEVLVGNAVMEDGVIRLNDYLCYLAIAVAASTRLFSLW